MVDVVDGAPVGYIVIDVSGVNVLHVVSRVDVVTYCSCS